jgi:adenylate cyclase
MEREREHPMRGFPANIPGITKRASVAVPLLITCALAALYVMNIRIVEGYLETLLVDFRFKARNLTEAPLIPDDIIIVTVDERSLAQYGRWPWSRTQQAALIGKVMEGEPRAAAVDIFYPEAESSEADGLLAEVFHRYRDRLVVALGFEVEKGRVHEGEIHDVLWDHVLVDVRNMSLVHPAQAHRAMIPPRQIAESAVFGHVYYQPDRDGKLRWENLLIQYGDDLFPSLALQLARIALGLNTEDLILIGGKGVILGNTLVPVDDHVRLHINYYGREGSFRRVSAADVLSDALARDFFRDRMVIIGTSAVGTYDMKVTPFSANMTGAEKNATVLANLLEGNFIRPAPFVADLATILLSGILVTAVCWRLRALYAIGAFVFMVILNLFVNQAIFTLAGMRMNLFYPLSASFFCGLFIVLFRYFIEERRGREIRRMFSSYATKRVVDELVRNPEMARLGGERREITVLFSDIKDFTRFSEETAPEEVVTILNEYLTAMTEVVFHWEGTLDKFMGDAIVAFWNAPLAQKDHAERALRCTLHMVNRLGELKRDWLSRDQAPFEIGVGINTGEVVVGNIGAEGKKMDYTIIGDHVNIGARLEGLNRKYGTDILISGFTLERIRDLLEAGRFGHVSIRGLEKVVVKGRETPVKVYEFKPLEEGSKSIIEEDT